ncbi:sensor histidine kinase [Gracilibacillus sp. S3-1-1]|uniref:Sensor histidine kinase n=1 Tax=Gracilibacillus pellucidus TaxID=3095368 RepID=A0ACC6M5L1_9BACI|nr:sensor histidine kinase [Gracilibacillus sp. S3-1-1]MDX8046270.1 sensor histidine kinase [Gracilibacillus sp. S3-1-1]
MISFNLNPVSNLSQEHYDIILDMVRNLQKIADISQADIFIDCLLPEGKAIVVAEAHPGEAASLYKQSVLGQIISEETEPGVLFSLKNNKSVIGSRGISQENIVMQQDIVPITDKLGKTIAVLVKEQDISQIIRNEHKIKSLMEPEGNKEKQKLIQSLLIQEIHHRVKNNLQVISSLLRLQMRRSSSNEVKEVINDSLSRISSMAMVHDYLAKDGLEEVDAKFVMGQIARLLISLSSQQSQRIHFSVEGESLFLQSDKATSLALIVSELIQNCIKHAFHSRNDGMIEIIIKSRKQMAYLIISDNGSGMDANLFSNQSSSLGLQLVKSLIEEELDGIISVFHSNRGTKISLTFPIGKVIK